MPAGDYTTIITYTVVAIPIEPAEFTVLPGSYSLGNNSIPARVTLSGSNLAEVDQVCIDLNTNNVCDANKLGENISNQSYNSLTVDLPNRSDGEGAISDGKYYVLVRNSDGSYSKSNNTFKYERVPALFSVSPGFYNVEGDRPKEMTGGNSRKIILMESGQVFTGLLANGSNDSGQLGIGESAGDSQDLCNITSRFAEGDKIISVSALGSFNLALSEKGRVYAWGNNQYGQIGNGSDKNVWEPLDIASRFGDKQIIMIKLSIGTRRSN